MSVLSRARARPYPASKVALLNEYVELLRKYRYLVVVDITGIPAPPLHELRRKLRERGALLKVVKNRVFLKAVERVRGELAAPLGVKLRGQNAVIFTNENPFLLILFLREYRMRRKAKPGDIATSDIVVPAGNTGIAPGPTMSLFGKLRIPIRVVEGSIWVASDTVVARKGDVISPELAELLTKLNLKPIELTIQAKLVAVDGSVVSVDEVELEPDRYVQLIRDACSSALNLALNACLPIPEVVPALLMRARVEAEALATALALPIPEVVERSIARAWREAVTLYNLVRQLQPSFS